MIDFQEKERLKERLKELLQQSAELSGKIEALHYVIENTYVKKRFLKNVESKQEFYRDRYNVVCLEIQSIYNQLLPEKPKMLRDYLEKAVEKAKLKYGSN